MKFFLKSFLFLLCAFGVKNAKASDAEFFRDTIDFGTVTVLTPSNTASASMSRSSPYSITGSNIQTGRTGTPASVRVTNTTSTTTTEYVSISSGTLSCTSNCDNQALACSISFTPSYATSYRVSANGRATYGIGGALSIPKNCGAGVFTGTATWTGSGLVSKTLTINIKAYLNVPVPSLVLSKTQDMNFGQVSSNQSHDVTINPNGCSISSTYPAGIISASGAKCGIFTIKNEGASAQALTSVTLPSSVTLSGSNGGTMSLDITSYPAVSSITSVPASTTTSVYVGGTLHVLSSNVAGTYTGNYTITVNY